MENQLYAKVVAAGCFHYPKMDKKAFEQWLEFVTVYQPECLYLLGGLIHSDFGRLVRQLPEKKLPLAIEELKGRLLEFKKEVLAKIRQAVPNAQIFYVHGQTEDSIKQWCEKQGVEYKKTVLDVLDLDGLKIVYVPEGKMKVGTFMFTNGKFSSKDSVTSAKAELKQRGLSGCSCCSHHLGAHFRTDFRGEMVWFETGCLAQDGVGEPGRNRQSPYLERAFLVGHFAKEKSRFHLFPVLIDEKIVKTKGDKKYVFFDPELISDNKNGFERTIAVSCVHVPFHHKESLAAFLKFVQWFRPNKLYLTGDMSDFQAFSKFKESRTPRVQGSLENELKETKEVLALVRAVAPTATIYYLEGNHEKRLSSYLVENAPALLGYPPLTVPKMLELDKLNIQWIPDRGGRKEYRFLTIHGDFVRKNSGETAKAELEAKGISGMSGHTHRLGLYSVTDEQGTRRWWEIGTLVKYTVPYIEGRKANWQRGFAAVYVSKDNNGKNIHVILIPVVGGKICFWGQEFVGDNAGKDKPKQEKPEEEKSEQEKPKQDKPKQEKPEEEKSEQEKPEEEKPEEDEPEEEKPEEEKAEEEKPEEDKEE